MKSLSSAFKPITTVVSYSRAAFFDNTRIQLIVRHKNLSMFDKLLLTIRTHSITVSDGALQAQNQPGEFDRVRELLLLSELIAQLGSTLVIYYILFARLLIVSNIVRKQRRELTVAFN